MQVHIEVYRFNAVLQMSAGMFRHRSDTKITNICVIMAWHNPVCKAQHLILAVQTYFLKWRVTDPLPCKIYL